MTASSGWPFIPGAKASVHRIGEWMAEAYPFELGRGQGLTDSTA